jgi:phenylalanyl-tRNA synthetase beta chain
MLVSLKWLADYVPLSMPVKELVQRLTLAGVKVERMISWGDTWDGIRVGEVEAVHPHPNADRLTLVTVDLGEAEKPTVVCGAPNVAPGQRVAYGPVGTTVFDGHTGEMTTLKAARIRGVESAGMVLSERELGLLDDHLGILVLPEDAPKGIALREYMGDTVLDLEITPNRPDLLSILGVAWEAAAQMHVRVQEPERVYTEAGTVTAASKTSVTIEDKVLCPRYLAGIVERVKVGPSPAWMQERLKSAGMRPINNVVDITNYVMLEMGQPLHAFDLKKLGGQRIVVRRARQGERMRTLDEVDRPLTPDMLVIADANRPVAIAGVMGGGDAEVSAATTSILLESANCNPVNIRATSTGLGLRTEASVRFEKALHPELAAVAIRRAMKLLVEVAGGRAAKGIVDTYPAKRADTRVVVTKTRIEQVLGVDMPTAAVRSALTELGFGCRWVPPDRYVVRAPYWRTDVTQADDVIEELARATGYDRIEPAALAGALPNAVQEPVRDLRERIKDAAVAAGLQEVINYPLTTTQTLSIVTPREGLTMKPPLRLENPMSSEQAVMRTSLRHSILGSLAANLRWDRRMVALFESARIYLPQEGDLPEERETVVAAIAGKRLGRWGEATDEEVDFFDAKGMLEEMLERIGARLDFRPHEEHGLLKSRTAALVADGLQVGVIGQVHPQVTARFELNTPTYVFEVDVERMQKAVQGTVQHRPLSRFPAVIQDIALLVDTSVPAGHVESLVRGSGLVADARLFDVYEGAPLPAGKRSLAYAVHFQAPDRTLTEAEVADARRRLVRRLERELGAELRGQG